MPRQSKAHAKPIFWLEFEISGLTQVELSRILGVDPTTTNRWIMARKKSRRPVPGYAFAFLRAWNLLTPEAKALLLNDASRN